MSDLPAVALPMLSAGAWPAQSDEAVARMWVLLSVPEQHLLDDKWPSFAWVLQKYFELMLYCLQTATTNFLASVFLQQRDCSLSCFCFELIHLMTMLELTW